MRQAIKEMVRQRIVLALIVLGGLSLFTPTPKVLVWGLTANPLAEAAGGEGGSCGDPVAGGCGRNSCARDQNRTVKVCAGETIPVGSCYHDEACCDYRYRDIGCEAGGCAMGYMRKRRTSNVSGCAATYEYCEYDASCPQPPPPPPGPPPPPPGSSETWQRYGFAVPDHPTYGFGLPSNTAKNLVGLAAKGNIIVGDYTPYPGTPLDSHDFTERVVPKLQPTGDEGVTRAHVVDPTDEDLGYGNAAAFVCGGRSPCFDGIYNQQDKENGFPAFKLNPDGSPGTSVPRKFYESSLADDNFRALVHPNLRDENPLYTDQSLGTPLVIDAALFTNHALAGNVKAQHLVINGTMVARDDALVFNRTLTINHDVRLVGDAASPTVALPSSIGRPVLKRRQECKPESCDP